MTAPRAVVAQALKSPRRPRGRVASGTGAFATWSKRRGRGTLLFLAAVAATTLMLAIAGQLGPLASLFASDAQPEGTPTGFPGEWMSATDATIVGATATESVESVWGPHWHVRDGHLRARVPYAYLLAAQPLRDALVEGASAPVGVTLTVLDDAPGWQGFGFIQKPGSASDVMILHQWYGTGEGGWRTESFSIPGGVPMDGWFYLSEGVTAQEIRLHAA